MPSSSWRTPLVVLICGGIILTVSLGTRHTFGLYLQPMTLDLSWSRGTFAIAMAIQNLIYGLATPFAGMIADKYGAPRALIGGTVIYAIGLVLMTFTRTVWDLSLTAGLLIGIGVSCSGFSVIFGVIARAFPAEKRTVAMGIAGAAGSFGQFVMLPYGQTLITHMGWQSALLISAATVLAILPLSAALVENRLVAAPDSHRQSITEALREAFGHSGFVLLCAGYFVCGFQLLFISIHFPAYLIDQRMTPEAGMMALALIGLFNIFGTYLWGWLGQHYTKKHVLATLYFTRAVVFALFLAVPVSPTSVMIFSATIGFLWLGTVPVTSGLVAQIFGVKYLATLSGITFMFHQFGSFIGIWAAGYLFDSTGSYQLMWLLTIALGVLAALVNLPINDRPLVRQAPVAA